MPSTKPILTIGALSLLFYSALHAAAGIPEMPPGEPQLLTDPFLQNPTGNAVSVVWMTNFEGRRHFVILGRDRVHRGGRVRFDADTVKTDRLFADPRSFMDNPPSEVNRRVIYRHEAIVDGLTPDADRSYRILSVDEAGQMHAAGPFTLEALPSAGRPLKILLTSDMQERYNTLANYQKVEETFPQIDAVFMAGDLINHPRQASEWFDNFRSTWLDNPPASRPAFFPAMQGRFRDFVPNATYGGGQLLQHAPLFPAIANHEVSGRFRPNQVITRNGNQITTYINEMFGDPQPRWYAEHLYEQVKGAVNAGNDPAVREQWIRDNSNDFESYREIFTLPDDGPEGESYYSKQFGDVFLIAMNVSRIWRTWNIRPQDRSKFIEILSESNNPDNWGFGEHIFTPFQAGSAQHEWLQATLESDAAKNAKYRVVMFHQSAHGLGDNAVPVLTDPVMYLKYRKTDGSLAVKSVLMPLDAKLRGTVFATEVEPLLGSIEEVRYEYPIESDYFRRDIEPLMHEHGVQLVLTGHSHVWNRSRNGVVNFMETSNVGNCFGAYWTRPDGTLYRDAQRAGGSFANELALGAGVSRWNPANYPRTDDPHGREPIFPTIANPEVVFGEEVSPVPFVCSNNISVFSILDTGMGAVRSYAFDVANPEGAPIEFDRFMLDAN